MDIDKDVVVKRINGIEGELEELRNLSFLEFSDFKTGDGFKLAQFHLHRCLEGVLNISSHILSRIPGAQATTYAEIAGNMGKFGIIEKEFAENQLAKMAKYRNRLVHFYAEVTPEELYDLIKNHLGDFDVFLSAIKKLL